MEQLEVSENNKTVAMKPPRTSLGVGGWMKENLFSSWINSILTIVAAVIAGSIINQTVGFIVSADWTVISVNFRLLMVGQFPMEEMWRIWAGLTLLSVLLGFSWGIWKGSVGHVAIVIGMLMLIMAMVPFVTMNTRLLLGMNIVLILTTYFLGKKLPKAKVSILVLWVLFIPIVVTILNGLGVFPPVRTGLWGGFLLTLLIASVSIVCSFPIGVLLALGRRSKLPVVKWFCIIYIEFIRGIPLITVLFVMQLMLPLFLGDGINIDNVIRAMTGFTLFSAAYLAENIRGGLQSLPRGQFEAAQALGLSQPKLMGLIILPQALRAVIPAMVGQFISIFKDTSLVAIVGLTDLLGMGKKLIANPGFLGKQMEVLVFIALIYFIFCYLMSHVSKRLEVSLGLGKR
ncbi:amino acid ABC transporter permease [Litchfieldia salsa]|uniref:General L-amino acid transport system permease protein n=1 Tax=Litchfieldia salsa TaxID=930152 RepID=A0A1H0WXB5_9BACI|nr:amino acid ABC transporter permease [Litchfieldia salsa]SDP95353.1 general L-amino acid transport system permease protein [Litchfieldia salsa]